MRSALRLIGACFLVAAFIYMFMTLEAMVMMKGIEIGYNKCLKDIPGVVPEKTIETSVDTRHPG